MKKLMIAAFAIAFAAVAQAASVTWGSSGAFYDINGEAGDWTTVAEGTAAYFVFVADYAQTDLVADFNGAGADMDKLTKINPGTINGEGTIDDVTGSSTTLAGSQDAYVVVFDGDNMFISDTYSKVIDSLTGTTYIFDEEKTGDIWAVNTGTEYVGAGWYAAPEPTSGLLMLLGMAGLALRRRRA